MSISRKIARKFVIITVILTMIITSMNMAVWAGEVPAESANSVITLVDIEGEALTFDAAENQITYYIDLEGKIANTEEDIIDEQIDINGNLLDAEGNVIRAIINENGEFIDENGAVIECKKAFFVNAEGNLVDNKLYVVNENGVVYGAVAGFFVDEQHNVVDVEGNVVIEAPAQPKAASLSAEEPKEEVKEEVAEAPKEEVKEETEETEEAVEPEEEEDPSVPKANATTAPGWKTSNGHKYYYYESGKYYKNTRASIDGKQYAFNSSGYLVVNNFVTIDGKKYGTDANGVVGSGVFKCGSTYYYANTKTKVVKTSGGWIDWNDNKYYAKSTGALYANAFKSISGHKYYFQADASMKKSGVFKAYNGSYYYAIPKNSHIKVSKGWVEWNGNKYYAKSTGVLYRNTFKYIGGSKYNFQSDAAVRKGGVFKAHNGYYYYSIPSNCHIKIKAAFITWNGNKYYVTTGGKINTSKIFSADGKSYAAQADGKLGKGIVKIGSDLCYADSEYIVKTSAGFKTIDDKLYYIKSGGKFARNGKFTVSGKTYIADANGVVLTGLFSWAGSDYYADSKGALNINKPVTINGVQKFVDKNGAIVYNKTFTYNGATYEADATGACEMIISPGEQIVAIALAENGTKTGKKYWDNVFGGSIAYRNGDATAWCGCFVTWCYRTAGQGAAINGCANPAYVPTIASWAKKNGTFQKSTYVPVAGDLIIFDNNVNGTPDHVGMVVKTDANYVYTIEGNTGTTTHGVVAQKSYSKTYRGIYGYAHLV